MDTELNSPPHQGGAVFKKPSNDESGRKYRRRALADDDSSSSDGLSTHSLKNDFMFVYLIGYGILYHEFSMLFI